MFDIFREISSILSTLSIIKSSHFENDYVIILYNGGIFLVFIILLGIWFVHNYSNLFSNLQKYFNIISPLENVGGRTGVWPLHHFDDMREGRRPTHATWIKIMTFNSTLRMIISHSKAGRMALPPNTLSIFSTSLLSPQLVCLHAKLNLAFSRLFSIAKVASLTSHG